MFKQTLIEDENGDRIILNNKHHLILTTIVKPALIYPDELDRAAFNVAQILRHLTQQLSPSMARNLSRLPFPVKLSRWIGTGVPRPV